MSLTLHGVPVILSEAFVDTKFVAHHRTWKERLFTWPWRPHVTMKFVAVTLPSEQVFRCSDKFGIRLFMHPQTFERAKETKL
jgi:hypothetical protein